MATSRFLASSRSRAKSVGRPDNFYPSPFFDIAQNYIPKSIKDTFSWCSYYQLTNPLISAVTNKLATYPITDLAYDDDNEGLVNKYRTLFERQFLIRTFLVETNLDRYTFGNAFVSVSFPFRKTLTCSECGKSEEAKRSGYKWKGLRFFLTCASCGHHGPAKVKDEPMRSQTDIRLIRWNPSSITIKHNEITGKTYYYYRMPQHLRNQITLGTPNVIETIPQTFIEAMRKKKSILLDSSKLFHARRPSISRDPRDSGWGAPLILPVLKDIFFLQVLRKAQEAVAMDHIVPMRVMFPQVTTDGNNPYAHVNLQDWQNEVQTQIRKWRQDVNHIPVMPVPVGYQLIGGQGRSLLLHQELRVYSDQIIAGMGVPTSFIYGEAQYSGASVNLRALENEFLGNRQDMLRLVEFIRDQVAAFLDLPSIGMKFKPFKMADDIQRASFDMNLANAGMISKRSFLQSRNFDFDAERELMVTEAAKYAKDQRELQLKQTEAQGEAQMIQTRYQIQAQTLQQEAQANMGPPPGQEGGPPPGQGGGPPPGQGQPPPEQGAQPPQQGQPQAPPPQQGQAQSMPAQGTPEQAGTAAPAPTPTGIDQSPINVASSGNMVDMFAQAKRITSELKKMDEVERYRALAQLRATNPDLYMLVNSNMGASGTPMKPLPEVLPPRAAPDRAQI